MADVPFRSDEPETERDGSELSNVGSILGSTMPRLWTPPLDVDGPPGPCGCGCALTPATSYGFDVERFAAAVLGLVLDPWQRWLVIHAGELLAGGMPRFRTVLVLVARQAGKTTLLRVLALYWLFVERQRLVLGTSTNRDYARLAWLEAVEDATRNEWLSAEVARNGVRKSNGDEELRTTDGCRYRIAASNRRGGRSLTIHRLILDELREHATWDAWNASTNATNAVPTAQVWAITNQGDDTSVVLDALREPAVEALDRPESAAAEDLGLFEWSAPDGSDPTDLDALAQANPNLGRGRTTARALLGAGRRAKRAGGDELAGYRTEVMCMRVHRRNPALDPDAWTRAGVEPALSLAGHRRRVALCLDLALDGSHATVVAAAVVEGLVHVEVVGSWDSTPERSAAAAVRAELPALVGRIRPRVVGWFPKGPAAAVAAALAARRGRDRWPPRGVEVVEITAELPAVCMGLAEVLVAGEVRHPRDAVLDQHTAQAERHRVGDQWVFVRRGSRPIDGAYALAGAVHLARTIPAPPPALVVL